MNCFKYVLTRISPTVAIESLAHLLRFVEAVSSVPSTETSYSFLFSPSLAQTDLGILRQIRLRPTSFHILPSSLFPNHIAMCSEQLAASLEELQSQSS